MKRINSVALSAKSNKFSFEELWNEINYDWEGKSKQLQARRWRQINSN